MEQDVRCRMCGKGPESVAHVVSGCRGLAETKYLARHNAALKILLLEVAKVHSPGGSDTTRVFTGTTKADA